MHTFTAFSLSMRNSSNSDECVSLQEIKEEVLQLAKGFGWREDGSPPPTSSSLSSSPRHMSPRSLTSTRWICYTPGLHSMPMLCAIAVVIVIIVTRAGGGARGCVGWRKHRLCLRQTPLVRHTMYTLSVSQPDASMHGCG
jgi:hypothetical protein